MLRPVLVGLVAFLLAVGACTGYATAAEAPLVTTDPGDGGTSTDPAFEDPGAFALQEEAPNFDSTTFEITVREDGSGEWTFRYERTLSSSDEVEQFETFAETFENEETDLYDSFVQSATALTDAGESYTGREMEATDFDRSARIAHQPTEVGVVEMSFTFTNFAPVRDDGTVVVSDVFGDGFHIMEDQTLTIVAGENLAFETVQPEAQYAGSSLEETNRVNWEGEQDFLGGHPYVVLVPEDGAAAADGSGASDLGGRETVVAAAFLAVLGLVAVAWYRFGRSLPGGFPAAGSRSGGASDSVGADEAGRSEEAAPIPDEELMSDEDRVETLIRRNGGRMKQVKIVEETGWSKSKVSMLLSEMEEEGTISKLRVGRENIISLQGFEPEATKSPFDE